VTFHLRPFSFCGGKGVEIALYGADAVRADRPESVTLSLCARHAGAPCASGDVCDGVSVELRGGSPASLRLRRGVCARRDLFYAVRPDRVIVSDRFAHVIRALPAAERGPCPAAVTDHFMFRAVTPPRTYCRNILRVVGGGVVEISLADGAVRESDGQRLPQRAMRARGEDHAAHVAEALHAAMRRSAHEDAALLFSGGVDSALLAALAPDMPLAHSMLDSAEFAEEVAYADSAAAALGRRFDTRTLSEEAFPGRLTDVVDRIGAPPHHAVTLLIDHAMETPHPVCVSGAEADLLFGFGHGPDLAAAAALSGPAGRAALAGLSHVLRGHYAGRLATVRRMAQMMAAPLDAPRGFGLGMRQPGLLAFMTRTFGAEAVTGALRDRATLAERAGFRIPPGPATPARHIATTQMVNWLSSDTGGVWTQVALSRGKTLRLPFADPLVVTEALRIPEALRYRRGLAVKHVLKTALARCAPDYHRNQRKLGGSLPILRLVEEGPLRDVFERFAPPEFLSMADMTQTARRYPRLLWHSVTFAVWRARLAAWPQTAEGPGPTLMLASPAPCAATPT